MAKLNEAGLKEHFKTGEFSNAYFIYGDEAYLKEFYISKFKSKLVDKTFESFNLHQYDGGGVELDDIIKDAQMLPMMSEYNLVIARDYPIEKSKNDMNLLKEFLEDVPDTTVFIFFFDAKQLGTDTATFKNLVKNFDAAGCVVNLEKRNESEVAKMLVAGAKKRGAVLNINNARYLISIAGNDLKNLLNELDKLSYFAKGSEITKEIIDNMATKCLQARIYDLSKAVVSGNSDAAYSVLNTLFEMKEEPIVLNSTISSVYIDMYRVKCAKSAGYAFSDVSNYYSYGKREFVLKNASSNCAKLTERQIRASIDEIIAVDVKLKSTAIDKRLLLEELIAKLLVIARESSYA